MISGHFRSILNEKLYKSVLFFSSFQVEIMGIFGLLWFILGQEDYAWVSVSFFIVWISYKNRNKPHITFRSPRKFLCFATINVIPVTKYADLVSYIHWLILVQSITVGCNKSWFHVHLIHFVKTIYLIFQLYSWLKKVANLMSKISCNVRKFRLRCDWIFPQNFDNGIWIPCFWIEAFFEISGMTLIYLSLF